MLGNGASELIDLVTRCGSRPGNFFVRSMAQYKEYERAAKSDGREMVDDPARRACALMAIVNPCNPTGEYLRAGVRACVRACAYLCACVRAYACMHTDGDHEPMQAFQAST